MTQILFVAGIAKSGSTIMDRLLATQPGYLGLGEVDHMLDDTKLHHPRARVYGPVKDLPCSCGASLSACVFWGPVMKKVLANPSLPHVSRYELLFDQAQSLGLSDEAEGKELTIVDSSKEIGALEKVIAFAADNKRERIHLHVVIVYRDPRDWLVSDDLNETKRGRHRTL